MKIKNEKGEIVKSKKVTIWNPTVANLTLMALGSSAPEILLSVIETTGNLGGCPGELGASTIVGSAAFNLFCVATGRLRSFHNPIGAHAWDLVAGVNLALEQGCEVLIDGEVYEGKFLKPTKKYCVDVFNL